MTEIVITKQIIRSEQKKKNGSETTICIDEQISVNGDVKSRETQILIEERKKILDKEHEDFIYDIKYIESIGQITEGELSDIVMKILYPKPIYKLKDEKKYSKFYKNVVLDIDSKKKQVNGLLNKVSNDNYCQIFKNITECISDDDDENFKLLLKYVIEKMFDIAIYQQSFCKLYSNMFNSIKRKYRNENMEDIVTNNLINKIENKYKECCNIDHSDNSKEYDDFCDYTKNKNQMIGIFQFMGELYRDKIFDDELIETYLNKLIKDIKDSDNLPKIIELQCECLCKFITTLSYRKFNNLMLKDIKSLSQDSGFPSRIKFMFLDLLDFMKKKNNSHRFAK